MIFEQHHRDRRLFIVFIFILIADFVFFSGICFRGLPFSICTGSAISSGHAKGGITEERNL